MYWSQRRDSQGHRRNTLWRTLCKNIISYMNIPMDEFLQHTEHTSWLTGSGLLSWSLSGVKPDCVFDPEENVILATPDVAVDSTVAAESSLTTSLGEGLCNVMEGGSPAAKPCTSDALRPPVANINKTVFDTSSIVYNTKSELLVSSLHFCKVICGKNKWEWPFTKISIKIRYASEEIPSYICLSCPSKDVQYEQDVAASKYNVLITCSRESTLLFSQHNIIWWWGWKIKRN